MKKKDFFRIRNEYGRKSFEERFHASYTPEPNSGCWLWIGNDRGGAGYGSIIRNNKHLLAHRASWEIHHGPIPDEMFVCHKCDVRSCVNPRHLFLGKLQDNHADMVRKGRIAKGERSGRSKLTNDQARSIKYSSTPWQDICAEYGIAKATVYQIRQGMYWRHL